MAREVTAMLNALTTALPASALPLGGTVVMSIGADLVALVFGVGIAALSGLVARHARARSMRRGRALRVVARVLPARDAA
jgi:hypothetical protein